MCHPVILPRVCTIDCNVYNTALLFSTRDCNIANIFIQKFVAHKKHLHVCVNTALLFSTGDCNIAIIFIQKFVAHKKHLHVCACGSFPECV